jgi:hypothetical protein
MEPLPEQTLYKPLFDLVADKANWKKPIDATVKAPTGVGDFMLWCQVMERAIEFYAGGGAKIEVVDVKYSAPNNPHVILGRTVRVTALGYYVMVGS